MQFHRFVILTIKKNPYKPVRKIKTNTKTKELGNTQRKIYKSLLTYKRKFNLISNKSHSFFQFGRLKKNSNKK